MILGDNIIEDDMSSYVDKFQHQKNGARIFLKEVPDPERFGVPEIKNEKIIRIEEKPAKPKSTYAVTGIYMYDKNPQLTEDDILEIGLQYTIPQALDGNFRATTTYDVRQKLFQIKVPVLIVRGESDLLMTAEMTKKMQGRIPCSRVVTVPNAGHNFLIQKPDLLWNIIKDNYNFFKGK